MAKQPSLFISIGLAGLDKFDKDLGKAEKALSRAGRNLKSIGKDLTMGLSAPIMGIGAAAFKAANDFETAFRPVKMLVDGDQKRIDELRKAVIGISGATGEAATKITVGMGKVLESFGDTADSAKILETNVKLAKVAQVDLGEAIEYSDAMADAWGQSSAADVERMSDLAVQAVKLNVNFGDLSKGMQLNAQYAAQLGMSQADLMAQIVTVSNATGDSEAAASSLKGLYAQLIKPSKQLQEAISGLGYENAQGLIKAKGFGGALEVLKDKLAGSDKEFEDVFRRAGSIIAVMKLGGEEAVTYGNNLTALNGSAGQTEKAFKDMADAALMWSQMKAQLMGVLIELGTEIMKIAPGVMEAMRPVIDTLVGMVRWFGSLSDETKRWVIGALAIVAAIGPVVMWFGTLAGSLRGIIVAVRGAITIFGYAVKGIQNIGVAIKGLQVALAFLSANPIVLIVAAVVGLGVVIWKYHDEIWAALKAIGGFFADLWTENIKPVFSAIGKFFADNWPTILAAFTGPVGIAVLLVLKHWESISGAVKEVYEASKRWLVDKFWDVVNGVQELVGKIEGFFRGLKDRLVGHSIVPDMVKDVLRWFGKMEDGTAAVLVALEEEAESWNDQFVGVMLQAFDSLADAMTNSLLTGKASFKEWVDALVADMLRLVMRIYVVQPIVMGFMTLLNSLGAWLGGSAGSIGVPAGESMGTGNIAARVPMPSVAPFASRVAVTTGVKVDIIDQRSTKSEPISVESSMQGGQRQLRILVRDAWRAEMNSGGFDGDFARNFHVVRRGR